MANRVPIPDDLVARVMFASDRTCCLCRQERDVQIHHIDGDPSNNAFDNLAVLCLICHSETQRTGGFVRNLTPELIRQYNASWREIVTLRLMPSRGASAQLELASEVFLEAGLDCHRWIDGFTVAAYRRLPEASPGQFRDIWDLMLELWIPQYSEEEHQRYEALFAEGLLEVQRRFDRLNQLFSDVLPADFRALLIRANRQLATERLLYIQMPIFISRGLLEPDTVGTRLFFRSRFAGAVRALRTVNREADRRRASLVAPRTETP